MHKTMTTTKPKNTGSTTNLVEYYT